MTREKIILYADYIAQVSLLSDAQAGILFKSLLAKEPLEKMDSVTAIAYSFMMSASKRCESLAKTRADAGHKGGTALQTNANKPKQTEAKEILLNKPKQTEAKEILLNKPKQTEAKEILLNKPKQTEAKEILLNKPKQTEAKSKDKKNKNGELLNRQESLKGEKDESLPPYKEIIDYLNKVAGTAYKTDSIHTRRCINGRWAEGFKLSDFKAVIDKKVAEWKGDPRMEIYIRPITLFSTKFESYLNEPERKMTKNSFGNYEQHDINYAELESKLDEQFKRKTL